MKIPEDATIPEAKLTSYLLVSKQRDDKSNFLAQAGFTQGNPEQLIEAIRQLAKAEEAVEDRSNEYGVFYRVVSRLVGVNGDNLSVVTIWLKRSIDNRFQFVTLIPNKGEENA